MPQSLPFFHNGKGEAIDSCLKRTFDLVEQEGRAGDEKAAHVNSKHIDIGGDAVAIVLYLPNLQVVTSDYGTIHLERLKSLEYFGVRICWFENGQIGFVVEADNLTRNACAAGGMLQFDVGPS